MRTKTVLLTAALGLVAAATTMAQVYSINAVGYINLSCPKGFAMVANQLNNGAGNKVVDVFAGVQPGTMLYKFGSAGYVINTFDPDMGGWDDPNMTLNPGEGTWIRSPAAQTVTLVGEVPQGTLTTAVPKGFWIVSSQVPQSGALDTVLKFPVAAGDMFYLFDPASGYKIYSFDPDMGGWDPAAPEPAVGGAFWSRAIAAKSWSRTFDVNNP